MVNEYLQTAISFYQRKKLPQARKMLLEIYNDGTLEEKVTAAFYLGKIAGILREKVNEVKTYFYFVILNGNDDFIGKAYMELGIYYRSQKNQKEMLRCYKKALEYIPNDIRLLTELGNYYLSRNDFDMQNIAQDYFQKILKLNRHEEEKNKFIRNQNIAYFGLAKSFTKQKKTNKAKEMLNQVEVQCQRDKEDINKCYGNIAVWEEKYLLAISFFQNNLKSHSEKVVNNAREKIGILYAVVGEYDKAITALEPIAKLPYKSNFANFILGKIYYYKKDYKSAYEASMKASCIFDVALLYALKSAMHFDDVKAIEVGNIITSKKELLVKYRPYLIYLSKKYNIFFDKLDYNELSSLEKAMIFQDRLDVYDKTIYIYNMEYGKYLDAYTIFEENLEERISKLTPSFCGGYYDTYYVKPYNSKVFQDKYLIVNTLKDTKEIIEIKIATKEQIDALDKKDIFENQKVLIKNLFK